MRKSPFNHIQNTPLKDRCHISATLIHLFQGEIEIILKVNHLIKHLQV
jgi:hypothetical protein